MSSSLQFPVDKALVKIDLDHPLVGMGDGAIVMESGSNKITFPFQIVSETAAVLNAADIMSAASEALISQGFKMRPVNVLLAN